MSTNQDKLWQLFDRLRTNTDLHPHEYFFLVLGLIFLKFADMKFCRVDRELRNALTSDSQFELKSSNYKAHGAIYLPPESRFDYLLQLPDWANIGDAVDQATRAIEQYNEELQGVLTTNSYSRIDHRTLLDLLRIVNMISVDSDREEGTFGSIFEYLLNRFALFEGQRGGQFFTPNSIVKLIVETIEPNHGLILDPACGSGGMLVQSAQFAKSQHISDDTNISIYGQEKSPETLRLSKMNMAVHGLSGEIRLANSYYEDPHDSVGRFDFVMANPPFNVSGVDKQRLWNDSRRYPFGIPRVDNANYLWIQMLHSALNENGRAGFVMPNSASDARATELEIRRHLIEKGVVDVMISIGSNFFYPTTLPCTLWFFDKGKRQTSRRDKVLFIDARHIYHQLDRSHRDFTLPQLELITNIVRLYRGKVIKTTYDMADLQKLFPKGTYNDVPSLCKVVSIDEIEAQNWSLNPLRYVVVEQIKLPSRRSTVFICYSHKDKQHFDRLRVHLSPFESRDHLEIWDDTRILPGDDWREGIKQASSSARVIIMLISADFLASKFIIEDELPPLLEAAHKEGVIILPVILSPCAFKDTQLGVYQAINSKPLSGMSWHNREKIWNEASERTKDIIISQK